MSVISSRSVSCFKAPVTSGPKTISMTGSWEQCNSKSIRDYRMSPEYLCHIRLGTWTHRIEELDIPTSLDWYVCKTNQTLTFYVHILFETNFFIQLKHFGEINSHVQTLLNKNNFILNIQKQFQQAHPGDFAVSGMTGNAGKDGDNQSD